YANIIEYGENLEGDLSALNVDAFISEMKSVAREFYRVLKPDHYCAILIGDTRKKKHYVPMAFGVMQAFLEAGFLLKEDIIKAQWNCSATPYWQKRSLQDNFFLIMHEHLFVFRKTA
ncbi:MAG: DNA methyltransferase, partial [Candidatus Aenigmarchaeota archaeon]|nr:DNA methyltransferase [Candidatus Aenigmarchaeota archaeon]